MVGSESSSFFLALRFSRVNNGSLQEVGTAQHPSGGGRPSPENISSDESSTLAEHHIAFLPCAGAGGGVGGRQVVPIGVSFPQLLQVLSVKVRLGQ